MLKLLTVRLGEHNIICDEISILSLNTGHLIQRDSYLWNSLSKWESGRPAKYASTAIKSSSFDVISVDENRQGSKVYFKM